MRKLKLDVGQLEVESFDVSRPGGRTGGTVRGFLSELQWYGDTDVCAGGSGATGPSNPVCIGPTYCCNPTANTGCCPGQSWDTHCGTCAGSCVQTCNPSCPEENCT